MTDPVRPPADSTRTPRAAEEEALRVVVQRLLLDLRNGEADSDKRRQVEDWMRSLAEKYPEHGIQNGLREYYLAEAGRLREQFENASDLIERLNLGRAVENYLEKAAEYSRGSGKSDE
ncbi:MAG TPA: hypothetical protein VM534_05655 [Thermoanaerobaculia bacterium]|nr:hypothetical protein [Thermoanaerobaculia bacterium]